MSTTVGTPLIPERPASTSYWKNDYQQVADDLINRLLTLRSETEGGWQDRGTSDGTQCLIYPRSPEEPLSMLPMFMGKTRVEGLTPLEIFSGIRVTGFRMMWDTRVQSAHIIRAFSMHEFLFYLTWRGIGPIYSPRDVAGIQAFRCWNQRGEQQTIPDFSTSNIILGYKGLDDVPGIPASVEGCVRANIIKAAFYIEQRDNGCDLTYIGHVDLAWAIPGYIMTTLTNELPRSAARLRDALGTFGVPPVLIDRQGCLALQYLACNPETRQISLFATIRQAGTANLYLDYTKMFTKGVVVSNILGSAATTVNVRESFTSEDGQPRRMLALDLSPEGTGGEFRLIIDAADKEGPDSGTGPGWW
ncbi:Bet v1-like protein [Testicularia cyperi]|uniref:Bet v1-like protein n=1 Tax=Testicularia cyperi TaxID=1882483 RepID=A0A317XKD1_9BASI|nr:Bet v1-like protein [Testicularia cyperi]